MQPHLVLHTALFLTSALKFKLTDINKACQWDGHLPSSHHTQGVKLRAAAKLEFIPENSANLFLKILQAKAVLTASALSLQQFWRRI